MQHIEEAELVELIAKGTAIQCNLVPRKDRRFEVVINAPALRGERKLMAFRKTERTFADPRKGFDWAKRLGISEVHIDVDLKRWPLVD